MTILVIIMVMVIITHQNPHDMKINLRQAAVTNVTPAAMMKKSGWRATWCLTIITMTMIIIKMVMMIMMVMMIIMVMMDDHGDKDDREDGVDDDTIIPEQDNWGCLQSAFSQWMVMMTMIMIMIMTMTMMMRQTMPKTWEWETLHLLQSIVLQTTTLVNTIRICICICSPIW